MINTEKIKSFERLYKLLAIITTFFIVVTINSISLANNEENNTITKDFELSSSSSYNGEFLYGVILKKDNEDIVLSIEASKYNLPSNLFKYNSDIRLRITYSEETYEVLECRVINYKTGKIIEDLSEENINKLFNIEYGKKIIEKNWSDKIKLSELKENEIYKYIATSTVQFPEIENDVGKNCIIYIKQKSEENYKEQINTYKKLISSLKISGSFNEYDSGEIFFIMYKKAENDELLKMIAENKIICLNNFKEGENLEYSFEEYIYNNTESKVIIHTKDTIAETEVTESYIIEKGEICEFDWMISSATISFSEEIENSGNEGTEEEKQDNKEDKKEEQTEDNEEKIETEQIKNDGQEEKQEEGPANKEENKTEQSKEDNTQATVQLPQTGESKMLSLIILFFIIISIISYKKYKS